MKKIVLLAVLGFICCKYSAAQIVCIFCYQQNDSISSNVHNLVLNGGFENTTCISNQFNSSFCPKSKYYSCTVANWICTGGGSNTYVSIDDSNFVKTADGKKALYMGDAQGLESACSISIGDTSCFVDSGCVTVGIPAGYPTTDTSYGGATGVSIEQTVSGLTIGNTYILEFWAGGEPQTNGWRLPGLFAVDIGFGRTYMRCNPTDPSSIGTRYLIEFKATSTSHTIKFSNWGHVAPYCTELILDNVRLYKLAELSPSVPACAPPVAALTTLDTSICANDCISFINNSTGATSWTWSFPGASPSSSTVQNPQSVCYDTSGTFNVKLVASNSLGSDSITFSNYISVRPPIQSPYITHRNDTLFINKNSSYASYQWYKDSTLIGGATDTLLVISQPGNYNVRVSDENGCSIAVGITVGIKEFSQSNYIFLFPNPATNKLVVGYSLLRNGVLKIYNAMGEVCLQSAIRNTKSEIDISSLPPGIYFVQFSGEGELRVGKFVKE